MKEESWTVLDKDFRRMKAIEAAVFHSLGQMEAAVKMARTKAGLLDTIEAVRTRLEQAVARDQDGKAGAA